MLKWAQVAGIFNKTQDSERKLQQRFPDPKALRLAREEIKKFENNIKIINKEFVDNMKKINDKPGLNHLTPNAKAQEKWDIARRNASLEQRSKIAIAIADRDKGLKKIEDDQNDKKPPFSGGGGGRGRERERQKSEDAEKHQKKEGLTNTFNEAAQALSVTQPTMAVDHSSSDIQDAFFEASIAPWTPQERAEKVAAEEARQSNLQAERGSELSQERGTGREIGN